MSKYIYHYPFEAEDRDRTFDYTLMQMSSKSTYCLNTCISGIDIHSNKKNNVDAKKINNTSSNKSKTKGSSSINNKLSKESDKDSSDSSNSTKLVNVNNNTKTNLKKSESFENINLRQHKKYYNN